MSLFWACFSIIRLGLCFEKSTGDVSFWKEYHAVSEDICYYNDLSLVKLNLLLVKVLSARPLHCKLLFTLSVLSYVALDH